MYQRILVPVDGSKLSHSAVKEAAALAKAVGGRLTLFYAAPAYQMPVGGVEGGMLQHYVSPQRYKRDVSARARRLLASAERNAGGVPADGAFEFSDRPYDAIAKAAARKKCDLIVMASHGWRGLKGLLLGSETHKVLTHSRIPVLVVR